MVNILLIFIPLLFSLQENYYQYTPTDFFKLEAVNQPLNIDDPDRELLEAAVFHASNEVRIDKRKKTFLYDPVLRKAARLHSEYLSTQNTVEHINTKQKKYRTPADRIFTYDDTFTAVAENLARISVLNLGKKGAYFIDREGNIVTAEGAPIESLTYAQVARKVVDGWMHSKGHRKNLLGRYDLLGCGVSKIVYSNDHIPEVYFTQNFGNK